MKKTTTTLRKILRKAGIKHAEEARSGGLLFWVGTKNYANTDGREALALVARLDDDWFQLLAPFAFQDSEGDHREAVHRACSFINLRFKLIKACLDDRDGELRLTAELPIVDGKVGAAHVDKVLAPMLLIADAIHPYVQQAIEKGNVDERFIGLPRDVDGLSGALITPEGAEA